VNRRINVDQLVKRGERGRVPLGGGGGGGGRQRYTRRKRRGTLRESKRRTGTNWKMKGWGEGGKRMTWWMLKLKRRRGYFGHHRRVID